MTVTILLIVLWQAGTAPTASGYLTSGAEECGKMAQSFIQTEEVRNAEAPIAFHDYYAVSCELKNGENPLDS